MDEISPWVNRIIGYENVDPATLIANPLNWRVHPQAQEEALEAALEELGWLQDIVVNRTTGRILDGHLRVRLALKHNERSVPIKWVELTEAQERLAIATFDQITALAEANPVILDELLRATQTGQTALQSLLSNMAATHGLNGGDYFLPVVPSKGEGFADAAQFNDNGWSVKIPLSADQANDEYFKQELAEFCTGHALAYKIARA